MKSWWKIIGGPILVLILLNSVFVALYSLSDFIPRNRVISEIHENFKSGVLKDPAWSIGRASTGWGIDFSTECIALGNNLQHPKGISGVVAPFYDYYPIKSPNSPGLDPCSGLKDISNGGVISTSNNTAGNYYRNWWGISIFGQIAVAFIGLATFKLLLLILNILFFIKYLYDLIGGELSRRNVKFITLLGAPYLFFSDFFEVNNSYPHSVANLMMLLTGLSLSRVLGGNGFNYQKLMYFAIGAGSIYNFMFWILPQNALEIGLISIAICGIRLSWENKKIVSSSLIYVFSWAIGFISTTLIKWLISLALIGPKVYGSILGPLSIRISQGNAGLNQPLQDYLGGLGSRPLWLNSILINYAAALARVIDPRLAIVTITLLVFAILIISYLKIVLHLLFSNRNFLSASVFIEEKRYLPFMLLGFPLIYYALTPNHSFNHATMTFRTIPLSVGGFLASSYLILGKIELKQSFSNFIRHLVGRLYWKKGNV